MHRLSPSGGRARDGSAATTVAPSVAPGALSIAKTTPQTLHFVAQADLKNLDCVRATGYITLNHNYLVYDTLFGTDANQQIKSPTVERFTLPAADSMKYTFTFRETLRLTASANMAHAGKIAPTDKKTFTLELAERLVGALGNPRAPFYDAGARRIDICLLEACGSGRR
jgi:hypothetical protein